MVKKSQGMINKEKYLSDGHKIPTCVNKGCNNDVVVRDWKYFSFKHCCGNCNTRMQKWLPPRKGVTFYKKKYCACCQLFMKMCSFFFFSFYNNN